MYVDILPIKPYVFSQILWSSRVTRVNITNLLGYEKATAIHNKKAWIEWNNFIRKINLIQTV